MISTGRSKFLVVMVIVLLLTNASMLWYIMGNKSKPETGKEEKLSKLDRQVAYMQKELHFDEAQKSQYLALRATRDSIMNPLNEQLRNAKMEMIGFLRQAEVPDSLVIAAAAQIAARQQPIELEFYNHFRRVQGICTPGQLIHYDSMLIRMVNRSTGFDDKKDKKD